MACAAYQFICNPELVNINASFFRVYLRLFAFSFKNISNIYDFQKLSIKTRFSAWT